jgi:hypothetical protein
MKKIVAIIFLSLAYLQFPYTIDFNNVSASRETSQGLSSNGVYDLEILNDSTLIIGTNSGLNLAYYNSEGNLNYNHFTDNNLVDGGNPALSIRSDIIAVSGVKSVETSVGSQSKGTGISYSINGGDSWGYMPQPIDSSYQDFPSYINKWACPWGSFDENTLYQNKIECDFNCEDCSGDQRSCMMYDYISWASQDSILNFSVTTEIQNVSYGIGIHGDYIYAASWAGSLRRFDYTLETPEWEVVPLPMDNQSELTCNSIDISTYQINPIGNYVSSQNCGYEFDNHKVFSVYSVEDTLWVGTANGINKGVVDSEACIDWEHLTADDFGFYDDWVIGFENQILDDGETNRLWAITWDREYSGSHLIYGGPPSYTDDGGVTWHTPIDLESKNLLTYNVSSSSEKVYVSSSQGLFESSNYQAENLWDEFAQPEAITTQSIFDAEHQEYFDDIFIATAQGICVYNNNGFSCESAEGNVDDSFYAYPNPFNFNETNQLTFVFNKEEVNMNGDITIYDLAMDRVAKIQASGVTRWNGNNDFGDRVSNGVYFAKYNHNNGNSYVFNIMVIN